MASASRVAKAGIGPAGGARRRGSGGRCRFGSDEPGQIRRATASSAFGIVLKPCFLDGMSCAAGNASLAKLWVIAAEVADLPLELRDRFAYLLLRMCAASCDFAVIILLACLFACR